MSKGLKALERIVDTYYIDNMDKEIDLIERELKVFNIIHKQKMISVLKDIKGVYFIVFNNIAIKITREEYDLLKEVLL